MHLKVTKALHEGAYLFFCAPHNLEPSAHKALNYHFDLVRILLLVRSDIIFRAHGFAYLAERDILRSAEQSVLICTAEEHFAKINPRAADSRTCLPLGEVFANNVPL